MSSLLEHAVDLEVSVDSKRNIKLFHNNNILKSKGKIFKPKYNKELKKKLKKYRLRRDGQEDPNVLDVSQILISKLKIKSPNNLSASAHVVNESEAEFRAKNYLFKMGRRKQIKTTEELTNIKTARANTIESVNGSAALSLIDIKKRDESVDVKAKLCESHYQSGHKSPTKDKDKIQKNAFALLMDFRNKSIGSNSPGKEKVFDELELQDTTERKNIKTKRNLLLQKMAEAKGALKKKEMEEYQEKCIKKKMEKRAERLKNMIKSNESKPIFKDSKSKVVNESSLPEQESSTKDCKNNNDELLPLKNTLKLVNIFDDSNRGQKIRNKIITEEDDDFLKKLSPSLKKKENMLCYFKKVEKDQNDLFSSQEVDEDSGVIKVKLTCKSKKKTKKKKLSLHKTVLHEQSQKHDNVALKPCQNDELTTATKANNDKISDNASNSNEIMIFSKPDDSEQKELDIIRPRRNVKRPAKYSDDVQLSSSDEELHIFTPKKKKPADKIKPNLVQDSTAEQVLPQPTIKKRKEVNDLSAKMNSAAITSSKQVKEVSEPKKNAKLAPIFVAKPQLDAAAIEAKQKFLSSGVPDKLKKAVDKQSNNSFVSENFHTVVHIQQNEIIITKDAWPKLKIPIHDNSDEATTKITDEDFFKNIISSKQNCKIINCNLPVATTKPRDMLQGIKQLYPKFPVYRTYRLLRDKNQGEIKDCSYLELDNSIEVINGMVDINNESPDKLSWTDKYKAMSSKQIIGNFESIKELKKWLTSWTENDVKFNKKNEASSDSSDFYQSDTDSKDSIKCTKNLLVLTGPVGSGKTSLVYAVAAELSMKVLEVNASSKRTGKIMLQDLQEATQSHKVNRGKTSQECSQKLVEVNEEVKGMVKKRGRPKKSVNNAKKKDDLVIKTEVLSQPNSQDSTRSTRTGMSLILLDDADIVFDQDDGFCSAIVQLVHCSKRPVILITSSTTCHHLQRFLQYAKIIHTRPFFPRMLGTWLDIMCLADSGTCWPGLGAKCLDYFNGDIRKSINFLQFHTSKDLSNDDEGASQNTDDFNVNIEEESSNMSWSERESMYDKSDYSRTNLVVADNAWQYFMKEKANLLFFKCPEDLFSVWWNIPRLLIAPIICNTANRNRNINIAKAKSKNILELDLMSNVSDIMSIADCYCPSTKSFPSALASAPWANFESHSVSEQENLDKYDIHSEIMQEISRSLVTGSVIKAQSSLDVESKLDLQFPGMKTKRERDRIISRHDNLTSYLNATAVLDRRALALDYWSGCRAICRLEKNKTDSNLKRNNRFCHYLKSANILCNADSFDNLGNSLHWTEGRK